MLKIKNALFKVDEAKLSAMIPDPYWVDTYNPGGSEDIFWSLNIACSSMSKSVLDGYGVNLSHESIRFTEKSWMKLEGQVIQWDEPFDEDGECNGSIYVFEHEGIPKGKLSFGLPCREILPFFGKKFFI